MRTAVLIVVAAAAALTAIAAHAVVPLIHNAPETEQLEVKATGELVDIALSGASIAAPPAGVLAARLAAPGRTCRWVPSPAPGQGIGGADLLDAALSTDESVLLLAERIGGGGDNPASTRLVALDVGGCRLVKGFELERRLYFKIGFIPGGNGRLWALERPQKKLNRPGRVAVIDPAAARVVVESEPLDFEAADAVAAVGALWLVPRVGGSFYRFDVENGEIRQFRSMIAAPGLLPSPDGRFLRLYGGGLIETYRLGGKRPILEGSAKLPLDFAPDWAAALNPDGSNSVFVAAGKGAELVSGGSALSLMDKSAAPGAVFPAANLLLLGDFGRDVLHCFQLSGTEVGKPIAPGRLKPANRNRLWRVLPKAGNVPEMLIVDHRANVYLLKITPKRAVKSAVLVVDRTGFR